MRTVTFPFIDRFASWPDARNQFKNTQLNSEGTHWVGEYYGSLTEAELPTYIPNTDPVLEYKTNNITKTEWRKLFELTEQITSDKVKEEIKGDLSFLPIDVDTPHPLIPIHTHRDILRTGYASFSDTNTIDVTDAGTILMINTMLMVGILSTQQRVDDILKGVLQEN